MKSLIFLNHQFKSFLRGKNLGKSISLKVIAGLTITCILFCVVTLGNNLDNILTEIFPNHNNIIIFYKLFLIYVIIDLNLRIQLQTIPTLKVQPYLHLAIKRNSIAQYLCLTSLFSTFNVIFLLIFIPFIYQVIWKELGSNRALFDLLTILGAVLLNNYLAMYIKLKARLNGWVFIIALLISILIATFTISSLFNTNDFVIQPLSIHWLTALICLGLGILMYYVNFYYIKENLYLEELLVHNKPNLKTKQESAFFNGLNNTYVLVANEVKLIFRNRRSKSALIMSSLALLYGVMIYKNLRTNEAMKVVVGMLITGIFITNYGQFMYGWQASHFDGLLSTRMSVKSFVKSKYLIFTVFSILAFILNIPYVYFGWRTLIIHLVMLLWNIGVNTTIVLFFANRNFKRIDLSRSASFNIGGADGSNWLLLVPLLIAPLIIYLPISLSGYNNIALVALAIVGAACIFTRNYWIEFLEADFQEKKYKILEGFRNK